MTAKSIFRIALFLLSSLASAAILSLLGASAATAQQYACDGTPGERHVYTLPAGNGIAAVPLCVLDEVYEEPATGGYDSGPAMTWYDSYLAHAGHPDASDVWIAAGYSDQSSAEAAALDACNRAMGGGCQEGGWVSNGAVAAAMDTGGNLWVEPGDDRSEARTAVERRCLEYSKFPCLVIRTADSPSWQGYPGGPTQTSTIFAPEGDVHRKYGAVAWTENDPTDGPWNNTVWLSGGHSAREQAEAAVSEACRRDSGQSCKVVHTTADTVLYVAVDPNGLIYVGSAAGGDLVAATVRQRCAADGVTCEVKGWFSAARNETATLDTRTARTVQ